MASLNKVFLIGNLTRDPELRYTAGGMAVANLGLATNRVYKGKDGEKKEETCFVRVVVWGRQAETCSQYLTKGSPLFVEGRLQSRSWETEDKQKRNTLEVVALNIQFLGGRRGAPAEPASTAAAVEEPAPELGPEEGAPPAAPENTDEIPF